VVSIINPVADIIIIVSMSILGSVLLEYGSILLKMRGLKRARSKISQSSLIRDIDHDANLRAQEIKRFALTVEEGDPHGVFLKLTNETETRLRVVAASITADAASLNIKEISKRLLKSKIVDSIFDECLRNVWNVRNRLIHGEVLDEDELSVANDLAVVLLSILLSLRIEHV